MKCQICNRECQGNNGLQIHLRLVHPDITQKEYYDKYLKKEKEGICLTCGNETPFISLSQGYKKHCNCKCSNNDLEAINKRASAMKSKSPEEKQQIINKRKTTCAKNHPDDPTCGMIGSKKHRETMLNIYGYETSGQVPEIKDKIAQTNLIKGGNKCSFHRADVKPKIIQKNMNTYGVPYYVQTNKFKEQRKEHFQTIYGEEITNNSQLESNKQKVKATNLQHCGYESNFQDPENKKRSSTTMLQRYNVPYYCLSQDCRDKISYNKHSKPNLYFEKLLNKFELSFKDEYKVDNYFYDFYLLDYNLLIEINPTATHNVTWNPFGNHKGIDKDYHYNKIKVANDNGYDCISIWDWDDKENILKAIKNNTLQIIKREVHNFIVNNKGIIQKDFSNKYAVEIYDDGQDIIY